jgi:hypothetical protein
MTRRRVVDDQVYQSPVDRYEVHWRRKFSLVLALLVLLALLAALAYRLGSDRPVDYRSDEDHFKYGSIGSEPGGSLLSVVGGPCLPTRYSSRFPGSVRTRFPAATRPSASFTSPAVTFRSACLDVGGWGWTRWD